MKKFNQFLQFMFVVVFMFLGAFTGCADHGGETVIQKGDQGDKGDPGDPGPQGPQGDPGVDGQSSLIRVEELSTSSLICEGRGGLVVFHGLDQNDNGELEDEEVQGSRYACNGADGQPGTNGTDGVDGEDGEDGTDGVDGTNGTDSIVKLVNESAGANCTYGGVKILVGRDLNDNGTLDTNEIEDWEYVCNGASTVVTTECAVNTNQNRSCGLNNRGTQTRVCGSAGTWGNWGTCNDNDVCIDGHTNTIECGAGHVGNYPERHCISGQWVAQGTCNNNAQCTSGATQHQACGLNNNGIQVRTCSAVGQWGAWGTCNVTPACHTFTVKSAWQFQGVVGEPGTGGWPIGEWVSCPDGPEDEICQTLTVCDGEAALFNVQSVPAQNPEWAISGQWSGTNWCTSPSVLESMFVGGAPSSRPECHTVCAPNGNLNWLCQF